MATGKALDNVADVEGTATPASANEVLINDLVTAVNQLLEELQERGWMDR